MFRHFHKLILFFNSNKHINHLEELNFFTEIVIYIIILFIIAFKELTWRMIIDNYKMLKKWLLIIRPVWLFYGKLCVFIKVNYYVKILWFSLVDILLFFNLL